MTLPATSLGYPRIGHGRALKRATEAFWGGRIEAAELQARAAAVQQEGWMAQLEAGLQGVPTHDFSLYDHVLDMAVCLGAVPERYGALDGPEARYFAMARGRQGGGVDLPALEMTKWFDTNYHYIVPEVAPGQRFVADATRLLQQVKQARCSGAQPRPVLLGPVTFLSLAKRPDATTPLDALAALLPAYQTLLAELSRAGVPWVQLDEPCLVGELSAGQAAAYRQAFAQLCGTEVRPKLLLTTYFGGLREALPLALASGCEGLHLDLVRDPGQLAVTLAQLPATMTLSVGVVDGRNVWRTDLDRAHALVRQATRALGAARVWVAPSCSLAHCPLDVERETQLDETLRGGLAFAQQKLREVRLLADAGLQDSPQGDEFAAARKALQAWRSWARRHDPAVRARLAARTPAQLERAAPYAARALLQRQGGGLPLLPTTTIGSFPQTAEVRAARAAWRAGSLDSSAYEAFLQAQTRACIARQEALGLDVLVHGEFERTDMVEHFGQLLRGFAFTEQGWVQSYGSRCVRPPLLYGDVSRPAPMTVRWSRFAQAQTSRPVKAMLTGPVTMLQWSFVRDDQPRATTCMQVALALRDEVEDLERAGLRAIQVDEPALREGLPLRRADWAGYLGWAVDAFRLATAVAAPATQVHTHMCYAEFGDILTEVIRLDADVLSIETSRSHMALLQDFATHRYPNEVGPGVYDIHSARVPSTEEMVRLLRRAAEVVPLERLWVNPDCGLKTRGWEEVQAALTNMVAAARLCRARLGAVAAPEVPPGATKPLPRGAAPVAAR